MNIVIAVLLAISFIPVTQNIVSQEVNVIFVIPSGEDITDEEITRTLNNTIYAVNWWEELSPITTTVDIESFDTLYIDYDVFNNPGLLYTQAVSGTITLFVIDNSSSERKFHDLNPLEEHSGAFANFWGQIIWILITYAQSDTIAHELGHVLYNLPDLYVQPRSTPPGLIDIMDYTAQQAYIQRFIGCESLKNLGNPCHRILLPMIVNGPIVGP